MTTTKPRLRFSRKLLAIPYALFLLVFVVAPLFIIIYYAFTNGDTGKLSFENFQNFFSGTAGQSFFESSRFKTIVQSFGISIASTLLCLLIAYPVAYIIAHSGLKNQMGLLLLFIVPMWVNFVLRINALKELLSWIGIYNKSDEWNIFNTILGMVYDFLPFMILPIYTTISKIDKSYLEAARDLGAGGVSAFIKVTLPLSKAGIMSGISMVFLPSMTNYVVSNYMTFNHTKIIGAFIDECFRNDHWNLGSVTALLLLTLMFVITWLTGGFNTESDTQSRGTSLW
ncbi:MAG: ABC transporter permease [Clostridia bacterium]|nr:ABC transporter permease [Clostridia bacterium]